MSACGVKKNLVSIVMPCYAMGQFIGVALQSIAAQKYEGWELLVVDDCGPDDGTAESVAEFSVDHPANRIQFIRHNTNLGVSAARNTAIEHATGEFVAFLDPDDYWLPGHLLNSLAVFQQHPPIGVVTSMVRVVDDGSAEEYLYGPSTFDRNWFPASLATRNFIQPSATVMRRPLLATVNCFDTNPRIQHVEDWDLWIKLAELNVSFFFRNEADSVYRKHSAAATSNAVAMRERSSYLIAKHLSFFFQHQSSMLHETSKQLSDLDFSLKVSLERIERNLNGPLMRLVQLLDKGLTRSCKMFRGMIDRR